MDRLGLKDKVVIVTGAAGGLGRAFALAFAAEGARVACADIVESGVNETVTEIDAAGGEGIAVKTDVTDPESTHRLCQTVVDHWGQLDVLVNNAAIYAGLQRRPLWEIEAAEFDRVMAVNVKGPWLCTKAAFPHMQAQGAGRIINISSATFFSGSPGWIHYVGSKGAIVAMNRAMAREMGDHGILVNAIAPGFTLTEASYGIVDDAANYGINRGAIKRGAQPEDIVGTALYLASDLSGFVTGQMIVVDGGREFH